MKTIIKIIAYLLIIYILYLWYGFIEIVYDILTHERHLTITHLTIQTLIITIVCFGAIVFIYKYKKIYIELFENK